MERNAVTGFKIDFDIRNYADILPAPPDNLEDIINWDKPASKCIWQREVPAAITQDYVHREVARILRTGVWIFIHKQLVWLPPSYYFFLQYFSLNGLPAEFRLKRLKQVYFKLRVRKNDKAIGTYTMKNRQDGETSYSMSEALWEVAEGNMDFGSVAMQSKTRDTVMNSCWRVFVMGYNGLPKWLKDTLYADIVSDDKLATKMKFVRPYSDDINDKGRDVLITYGSSSHNAFDSMNNMRKCILDEVNKWLECSFYATFLNYEKFIAAGTSRKGLFDIFSSPADTAGKHSDEALSFWKGSDPDKLTDYGSTETRVFRYYSNPLEGIEGMYDQFGDADGDDIKAFILRKRASLPKDKLMGEIRAYPLSEEEMFGAFDGGNMWDNVQGIKDRSVFLIGRRFKDPVTKEPIKIYGNLERVDGYIDGEVEFRPSDKQEFDVKDARFCVSFFPQNKQPLTSIFRPPSYVERCIGLDPFNNKYEAKNRVRQSKAAMVCRQFRDLFNTGVMNVPTGTYYCRPQDIDIVFEDCLMFAIWNRAMIQVESKSDKMAVYAEERGYSDWLLGEMGSTDSRRKGDAPSGSNRFLTTGISLINKNTNLPIHPGDPYFLDNHWHSELLEDYLQFNPLDTHENDLSMADIQSLVGCIKLSYKKIRDPDDLTDKVFNFLLN